MPICRTEYFECETIKYDYRKGMMVLVAEYCMPFGTSPASNIAQRLAILITDIAKGDFDEEESAYMAPRKQQLFEKPSGQWDRNKSLLKCKLGNLAKMPYT